MATRPGRSRGITAAALALAAALVLIAPCVAIRWQEAPPPSAAPIVSLLAVGDTGDQPSWLPALDKQRAVAAGMESEDRRAAVDALVLLGDNFYESGLDRETLVDRVRGNVVEPFCHFVELAGPRSAEVLASCPEAAAQRQVPPIYVVLGNHDSRTDESRRLEQEGVPRLVSNWRLSPKPIETVELPGGVSLVLIDSTPLERGGDPGPLRDALRASRGPWRILAAHHPIGTSRDLGYTKDRGIGDFGALVQQAIREAQVDVQLMLGGHEHNLQLLRVDPPGPRVVVVSGAGSRPRPMKTRSRGRVFSREGLGFARVDLTSTQDGPRLVVSLFETPRWRSLLGFTPELLGRWTITASGDLRALPLAVRTRDGS
jgi:hypothetical protein